jgi:hypothetical protein
MISDTNAMRETAPFEPYYSGFSFSAMELKVFVPTCGGLFSIMLINGDIIHFAPDDPVTFLQWLTNHRIRNIKAENMS